TPSTTTPAAPATTRKRPISPGDAPSRSSRKISACRRSRPDRRSANVQKPAALRPAFYCAPIAAEQALADHVQEAGQRHGQAERNRRTESDADIGLPFGLDKTMALAVARQEGPEHDGGDDEH